MPRLIIKKITGFFIAVLALAPASAFAAPIQCQCVLWLRVDRGINIRGDAYTIVPNVTRERADKRDVLLFDIGRLDHAAEITGFEGEMLWNGFIVPRYIDIIEANFKTCKVTTRRIEWNDPTIKGVYRGYPQF